MPFFYRIKDTLLKIYTGKNVALQVLAVLLTVIIVYSGFDWWYFKEVQSSLFVAYLMPAVGIGMMIPLFGIPLLYLVGKWRKNNLLLTIMWTLTQSAFLGWLISSFYKAFTGRVQPPRHLVDAVTDASRNWNFGFLRHGIFWGWPSSHTTVAFAMAFSLIFLFPKQKSVLIFSFLYALYIGVGVSMRIHWFSEFVAGAIIGAVIGAAVGMSFRDRLYAQKK